MPSYLARLSLTLSCSPSTMSISPSTTSIRLLGIPFFFLFTSVSMFHLSFFVCGIRLIQPCSQPPLSFYCSLTLFKTVEVFTEIVPAWIQHRSDSLQCRASDRGVCVANCSRDGRNRLCSGLQSSSGRLGLSAVVDGVCRVSRCWLGEAENSREGLSEMLIHHPKERHLNSIIPSQLPHSPSLLITDARKATTSDSLTRKERDMKFIEKVFFLSSFPVLW